MEEEMAGWEKGIARERLMRRRRLRAEKNASREATETDQDKSCGPSFSFC
jgi:hypothetical protein